MTMTKAEEAIQNKRERKRKCDTTTPRKKRTKEDEKENLTGASSPSSSSSASLLLSENSRESSSNHELTGASRRKNYKPKKLQDLDLIMDCLGEKALFDNLINYGILRKPLFLARNVIQKRKLTHHNGYSLCFTEVKKSLQSSVRKMTTKRLQKLDNKMWFQLECSRIMSWANNMEAVNDVNATSKVDLYTVFLSKPSGFPLTVSQGFSIVPLNELNGGGVKAMFAKKKISFNASRLDRVSHIYVAAVVSKMAAVVDQSNKRRSSRAFADPATIRYEKVTRFGVFLLYDKFKNINTLDKGIKTMVLVDQDDNPNYDLDIENEEKMREWLETPANLDLVNLRNAHKENSHLPRLIFTTDLISEDESEEEEEEEDTTRTVRCLRREATQRSSPKQDDNSKAYTFQLDQGEIPNEMRWTSEYPQCPFRKYYFSSNKKLQQNMEVKFPCFFFETTQNGVKSNCKVEFNMDYFKDNDVSKICLYYRPSTERSFSEVKKTRRPVASGEDDQCSANDDEFESNSRKFGLDFCRQPGHLPVIETVYRRAKSRLLSNLEKREEKELSVSTVSSTENDDDFRSNKKGKGYFYPVNNPLVFTKYIQSHNKHSNLLKINGDKEMQVVERKLSQKTTDEYNQTYTRISARLEEGARIGRKGYASGVAGKPAAVPAVPDVPAVPGVQGYDPEGRPIPTHAELFFPYGKNELYNVFQRFFYSENGIRPGVFSPVWMSNVMTAFLREYHAYIFENELDALFQKHLTLLSISTEGWNSDHFVEPLKLFRELKKQWKQNK